MLNPAREPRWGRSCGGRGGIRHRDGWGRGRGTGRGRSTSGVDRGREPQLPWWLDGGGDLVVSKPSHKEFGSSSSPTPPFFGGRVFGKNFRGCCFCFLVDFVCWMLIEKKKNCKKQSIFCQNIVSMFLRKRVLFVFFDLNVNFKMETVQLEWLKWPSGCFCGLFPILRRWRFIALSIQRQIRKSLLNILGWHLEQGGRKGDFGMLQ